MYTFEGKAGDIISAQLSASSGNLDPSLILADSLGNQVARNDDDLTSGTVNAALRRVQLPADGFYSLIATRYQGITGTTVGDYRLKLALDLAGPGGELSLRFAVLDPIRSGSIRDDGETYSDFVVGNQVQDDGEHDYDSLFTFHLPPFPESVEIEQATLDLSTCADRGSGFAALQELTVLQDFFESLFQDDAPVNPSPDAQEVARLQSCQQVDVSSVIQQAYASGDEVVQFRVTAPQLEPNGETEAVVFAEPRLSVLRR